MTGFIEGLVNANGGPDYNVNEVIIQSCFEWEIPDIDDLVMAAQSLVIEAEYLNIDFMIARDMVLLKRCAEIVVKINERQRPLMGACHLFDISGRRVATCHTLLKPVRVFPANAIFGQSRVMVARLQCVILETKWTFHEVAAK